MPADSTLCCLVKLASFGLRRNTQSGLYGAGWEAAIIEQALFDDQFSAQHPHLALEAVFAGFVGGEL